MALAGTSRIGCEVAPLKIDFIFMMNLLYGTLYVFFILRSFIVEFNYRSWCCFIRGEVELIVTITLKA